jgi:hypothetical protein
MYDKVQIFKFISGEVVLAKLLNTTEQGYSVEHPISVFEDGQKLIMAPWLQYSSNRVFFIKDAALAVSPATATEELAQKYLELTGSIVVPSQPKIILN